MFGRLKAGAAGLCLYVVLLSAPLLFTQTVFAQTATDYFQQGIKASESGDYQTALKQFKKAKQAGLESVALQYNLAVSYYRLRRYEEARQIFTRLTDAPKFEQIAYFNLGLIANKQKDKRAAIRWFKRAYRSGGNDKVRKLAAVALKRLGVSKNRMKRPPRRWTGFVSGSVAHDSNVTLTNEDLVGVTSKSDTAVDLSAFADRWLRGGRNDGLRVGLGLYQQRYQTLDQYNFSQYSVHLTRYGRLNNLRMRFGAHWDENYFDNSEYQRVVSADVRGGKALSKQNQLRLSYKLSRIQATDSVFEYLEGWRQRLRAGLQQRRDSNKFRYYYQLEINNRSDYATATRFTSYSPIRHVLRATGWWNFTKKWRLRLDGRFRYSRYNDAHILSGGESMRREGNQIRLSAKISYEFSRDWEINAQTIYTNNDSSIDQPLPGISYSYTRSLLKAGVKWSF